MVVLKFPPSCTLVLCQFGFVGLLEFFAALCLNLNKAQRRTPNYLDKVLVLGQFGFVGLLEFFAALCLSLNKAQRRTPTRQYYLDKVLVFQIKILAGVQTLVWKNQDKSWTPSQNIFRENYIS
jgi:hypothetical protein